MFSSGRERQMLRFDAVTAMRSMEEFTRSVGGYHFLYADTFLTRWPFVFNICDESFFLLVPGRNLRRCLTQLLTSEFAPNITLKVERTKIETNHIFPAQERSPTCTTGPKWKPQNQNQNHKMKQIIFSCTYRSVPPLVRQDQAGDRRGGGREGVHGPPRRLDWSREIKKSFFLVLPPLLLRFLTGWICGIVTTLVSMNCGHWRLIKPIGGRPYIT